MEHLNVIGWILVFLTFKHYHYAKEITIQDIDHLLHVIGDSIRWASEHEERAFPLSAFREYRRNLKKIRFALEEIVLLLLMERVRMESHTL